MRYPRKKTYCSIPKYQIQLLAFGFITLLIATTVHAYKRLSQRQPLISPLPLEATTEEYTQEQQVNIINLSDVVDKIWALESSRGKAEKGHHIYCKSKGMSNEYGYGVNQQLCFRSHREATAMVYMWFVQKLETHSLKRALCLYNTGNEISDCQYYQDFQEVK